jgi:hypothetical protein
MPRQQQTQRNTATHHHSGNTHPVMIWTAAQMAIQKI